MNKEQSFSYSVAGLILLLFIAQIVAFKYFLYWELWWFDIVMHFLGGAFVGLLALYLYYYSPYITPRHFGAVFIILLALFSTAFIGTLWELYEFGADSYAISIGKRDALQQDVQDTLGDLFMDLLGAFVGSLLYMASWRKK